MDSLRHHPGAGPETQRPTGVSYPADGPRSPRCPRPPAGPPPCSSWARSWSICTRRSSRESPRASPRGRPLRPARRAGTRRVLAQRRPVLDLAAHPDRRGLPQHPPSPRRRARARSGADRIAGLVAPDGAGRAARSSWPPACTAPYQRTTKGSREAISYWTRNGSALQN